MKTAKKLLLQEKRQSNDGFRNMHVQAVNEIFPIIEEYNLDITVLSETKKVKELKL